MNEFDSGGEFVDMIPNMLNGAILLIIIPLVLLQVGLMVAALVSLLRKPSVSSGDQVLWLLLIVLVNLIGPIIYFAIGSNMLDEKAAKQADEQERLQ